MLGCCGWWLLRVDTQYGPPLGPDRALAEAEGGDPSAMAEGAREALHSRPIDGGAFRMLGMVAAKEGANDRANELYRIAVRWDPREWRAHAFLMDAAFRRGAAEKGVRHLDALLRVNPDLEAPLLESLAADLGNKRLRRAVIARVVEETPWAAQLLTALRSTARAIYGRFADFAYPAELASMVEQPDSFTGRGAIWSALTSMISDRPILGFGYGSVFLVGDNSPWFGYATGWAVDAMHGHNGYLETLATTGVIGLALALLAFVVDPIRLVVSMDRSESALVSLVSALLIFVSLHNTMESSLMVGARPEWVTLLVIGAVVRWSCSVKRTKRASA